MPNPDHPIDITRTGHSVLPWRLRVRYPDYYGGDWMFIPYAACRTKRDALALRATLEAAADWSVPLEQWPEAVRITVTMDILAHTESAQIERDAFEAEHRQKGGTR